MSLIGLFKKVGLFKKQPSPQTMLLVLIAALTLGGLFPVLAEAEKADPSAKSATKTPPTARHSVHDHHEDSIILMPNRIVVPPTLRNQVTLKAHDVSVKLAHHMASTTVEQTFENTSKQTLEAKYLFPLPEDAQVTGMSLTVNGKTIEPELLGKDEAKTQYLTILHKMIDPGLLEYVDNKTVQLSVGLFFANETKKVKITYQQPIKTEGGLAKYQYYWGNAVGTTATQAENTHLTLNITGASPLKTIYSPSHTVQITRQGDKEAAVSLSLTTGQRKTAPSFVLYYGEDTDKVSLGHLAYQQAGEDGYFLMTLRSPLKAEKQDIISKNMIFVLDNSGSMSGEKLKQGKEALKYILKHLNPTDRFNIVVFNSDVKTYTKELKAATPDQVKDALNYVEAITDEASTNIEDALKVAFKQVPNDPERPDYVVFLTDGEPTVGQTDTAALVKVAKEANSHHAKFFAFGVGYDVRTPLLNQLSSEHHGSPTYVEPNENLELVLSQFYSKMVSPVMTDVRLTFDGVDTDRMYPKEVGDLFVGSEVLLLGRFKSAKANAKVTLTGLANGKTVSHTYPINWTEADNRHSFLPKLWAGRRIGALLTQMAEHGENNEVKEEVVALSKKYAIITPYTSYLATEKSESDATHRAMPAAAAPLSSLSNYKASTGGGNVKAYKAMGKIQQQANVQDLEEAQTGTARREQIQSVRNKTFIQNEQGIWVDTTYEAFQKAHPGQTTQRVVFGSDEYIKLVQDHPDWTEYLSVGQELILVVNNTIIQILLPKA